MTADRRDYHIVHTESSGGWGGQEIRILNEMREFVKLGFPVTLVCDIGSPIALRAQQYELTTVQLPMGKKTIKGLFALRRWIAKNDCDVINTHSSSDSWMVAVAMLMTFKNLPIIRTRHVSAPVSNNRATSWLYQKAAAHIVTTGERLRQTLIRDNGISPDNVTSVPTGIDCDIFTPTGDARAVRKALDLPLDTCIIGIVATLRSWKGHSYLLDAFSQIDLSDSHLLIVGNGPQWDNINQQIDRLGIRGKITMCGDQQDVVPWMQAMDIFALPSYANEGVPQGLMQAMACGLPVISTDVGSIVEIVDNNKTGIIVEKQSAAALAQAITILKQDDSLRQGIAERALRFARQNCGIDAMRDRMNSVFLTILDRDDK
jgi:glycosyltransferase involved in cell wall biosynthesis